MRVTEVLREKDAMLAMSRLALMSQGIGDGTRMSDCLATFNDHYARRALNSRSVLVVLSDGYDTGDPAQCVEQLARLKRRVRRLIWLNPLLGWDRYEPVTRTMRAAMPFIDHFASAHSLDATRGPGTAAAERLRTMGITKLETLALIEELRARGEVFCVVTVVRTADANSAKAGAKVIVSSDGTLHGFIGGGCVQGAIRRVAAQVLKEDEPRLIRVRPREEAAASSDSDGVELHQSGCPSGGTVDLFLEPICQQARPVLYGASPVTVALARLARAMGYRVALAAHAEDHALRLRGHGGQPTQDWSHAGTVIQRIGRGAPCGSARPGGAGYRCHRT